MKKNTLKKLENRKEIFIVLALCLVLLIMMAILAPGSYFTTKNLKSILFQFPEYGILAFGMMFAMISGGIDLSLVGIMNLSGLTAAKIMILLAPKEGDIGKTGVALVFALSIISALIVGAICGLFNGFIIGYFKIPAMLVTLCSLQIFTGLVYGITGGPAVTGMRDEFKELSNGTFGNSFIPYVLPIFVVVLVVCWLILQKTKLGKEIYYLGSSEKVSQYSGINLLKVNLLTYMISGILGGVSGVLITSHLNAAKSSNGSSYTLLTILVVVLGGVSPRGGKGKVLGVTLSIILMQMVSNAFTLLHLSQDAKNFANGLILIIALVILGAKFLKKK